MVLVYQELGSAALAGVAVLAVLVPFNAIGKSNSDGGFSSDLPKGS